MRKQIITAQAVSPSGRSFLWGGAALLLTAVASGNARAAEFRSPSIGVAFNVPDGYRVKCESENIPILCFGPENGTFASKISFTTRNCVYRRCLPTNAGSQLVKRIRWMAPDYQEVARGRFLLNGREAVMVSGVYQYAGVQYQNCAVATVRGSHTLQFAFTTAREKFRTELPIFLKMMDSVRWNPGGPARTPAPPMMEEEGDMPLPHGGIDAERVTLAADKISFSKPPGWTRYNFRLKPGESTGKGRVIFSAYGPTQPGKTPANTVLTVEPAQGASFPENLDSMIVQEFASDGDKTTLISHERTTLFGLPCYSVVLDAVGKNQAEMRVRYVMVIRRNSLYTFAFLADKSRYQTDSQDFNSFLGSVRFK